MVHMQDRANPRPRCAMSETYQDIVARLPTETELIRNSPIVSRPVLAEFAKWYTITTKIKLSCMWHQFTPKANPCE